MRLIGVTSFLFFVLVWVSNGLGADSTTIAVAASADEEAETFDGASYQIRSAPISVMAFNFTDSAEERRSLFAFPLAAIPLGATVTSASFGFQVVGSTVAPDNTIQFFGSGGDGVLQAREALNTANLVGSATTPMSGFYSTTLGATAINAALNGASSHFEIVGAEPNEGRQCSIASMAGAYGEQSSPLLQITYVPDPCAALFMLLAPFCLRRARRHI